MRVRLGSCYIALVALSMAVVSGPAAQAKDRHGGAFVGGLIAGALIGGAAIAASQPRPDYYYGYEPAYRPPPPPYYAYPPYCGYAPYPPCAYPRR